MSKKPADVALREDDPSALLYELEKAPYPTAKFAEMGESLRILSRNETNYTPPIRSSIAVVIPYIIVPTHRNVRRNRASLTRILRLARAHGAKLIVFLCSGEAKKEDIAHIAQPFSDLQWIAIDGPFAPDQLADFKTTHSLLAYSNSKDISQKRNFALLLARVLGWESVFFIDDDVVVTPEYLGKAADLLQGPASIVGFSARHYPDNSVVVHAERWTDVRIDSFLGAGALAVKTTTPMLSFFPHVYNEDWLFLLFYCLQRESTVTWAGTVGQRKYNPFQNALRAKLEEPGDLLAEALMQLAMTMKAGSYANGSILETVKLLCDRADERFWEQKINERIIFVQNVRSKIKKTKIPTLKRWRALRSLASSLQMLVGTRARMGINAAELANWLRDWAEDLVLWNAVLAKLPKVSNIASAMQQLHLKNAYISNSFTPKLAPPTPRQEPVLPEWGDELLLRLAPNRSRSPRVLRCLRNTQIVEDYLANRGLRIDHIADSASRIRFDRPTSSLTKSKPVLTISVFIAVGESLTTVGQSIHDIVAWNERGAPIQVILWIFGASKKEQKTLRQYRNAVVARCIPEVIGTNVRLNSSIIPFANNDIDQTIDTSLTEMAFAYWKFNIPTDHPLYAVNSKNEPLRWGTFWQFMQQLHRMPNQSLKTYLQEATKKFIPKMTPPITHEADRVALDEARLRLAKPPVDPLLKLSLLAPSPTALMTRSLRRANLNWLQVDDFAFDVITRHLEGEDALGRAQKIICIPIVYKHMLASDRYNVAKKVLEVLRPYISNKSSLACMIIVYATQEDPWEDIVALRMLLLDVLVSLVAREQVILSSWIYQLPTPQTQIRPVASAVVRYAFWLQNHKRSVTITWRSIGRK